MYHRVAVLLLLVVAGLAAPRGQIVSGAWADPVVQPVQRTAQSPLPPLEPLLPGLAMPALLLWGDQDKILDVSAAQVFKQGLPHVEAVIWPNVGHAPMLEKAADSARLYAGFIGRYPVR